MRREPDAAVIAWLDRQPADAVWITAVTLFEARLGLALLPRGARSERLRKAFDQLLDRDLAQRVLGFDAAAAAEAASLAARRQKAGRPVDFRDTQIAGIVQSRRATLATRNVRHFSDLDVPVVDPWQAAPP